MAVNCTMNDFEKPPARRCPERTDVADGGVNLHYEKLREASLGYKEEYIWRTPSQPMTKEELKLMEEAVVYHEESLSTKEITEKGMDIIQKMYQRDLKQSTATDPVNHPKHYNSHPSGVECIQITRHMGFNIGNAIKYLWRADEKGAAIEDLRKAVWYIEDEIKKRLR